MRTISAFLFVLLCLPFTIAPSPAPATFSEVTVHDLRNSNEEEFVLLDVREPRETAQGYVEGAILIPLGELESRLTELEFPTDMPLHVICRSGNRSAVASEMLIAAGFEDVRNVLGGMISWERACYPVHR